MEEKSQSSVPNTGGSYGNIVDLLREQQQQQEIAQQAESAPKIPTEVLERYMVRIIRLLGDGRPISADKLWDETFRVTQEESGDTNAFPDAMGAALQILIGKNTVHAITGQDDQTSFLLSPEISSTL